MKIKKQTLILALALILIASAVLTAGMTVLANENVGEQPIDPNDSIDTAVITPEKTKVPISVLQEKFGQFNHPGEGNSVTLYSDEQFEAIAAKRNAGERFYLTEEEFDYLVSDTLKLYMEYDEIVLNNAMTLPCFAFVNDPAYDTRIFFDKSKSALVFEGDDVIVHPQHRDGVYYSGEYTEWSAMEQEIANIVLYRVEMSDSGLVAGNNVFECRFTGENSAVVREYFAPGAKAAGSSWSETGIVDNIRGAALVFDEGAIGSASEYKNLLSFGSTQGSESNSRDYYNESGFRGISFSYYFFSKITAEGEKVSAVDGDDILPYHHGGYIDLWFYGYNFDREVLAGESDARTPLLNSAEYVINTGDSYEATAAAYGVPYTQYMNVFTGEAVNVDMDLSGNYVRTAYYVSEDGVLFTICFAPDEAGVIAVASVTSNNLF